MECPVCYTNDCNCKLVCGHSFCKSCIKDWYMKTDSEPTCPMCRSNLYFKGMSKVVNKWDIEFEEQKWEDIYTETITTMEEELENGEEFLMFLEDLELAYKTIRELHDMGYEFSWDNIREMLKNPYIFHVFRMYKPVTFEIWDDFETIRRQNMFVSRYPKWNGLRI